MTEAIKIIVERGGNGNTQRFTAYCDTDCFIEGLCDLETCARDDDDRYICCAICESIMECDMVCSRVKKEQER